MKNDENSYKMMFVAAMSLMVLAVVTLLGIAVVDQFGYTLRDSTVIAITEITPLVDTPVSLGASYSYPQTLTGCFNASNAAETLDSSFYTIDEGLTGSSGGTITLLTAGADFNNTAINCSTLTYLAASTESASADTFSDGLAIFATFSVVVALALIGKLIVNIFRKK